MKKILFLLLVAILMFSACNQSSNKEEKPIKQEVKENVRYKMFPTENIWTFLKLDTKTGKIWQVQYSIDENYRGEVKLNSKVLYSGDDADNGRFTLYPTKNMYNFILLDQIKGDMWQVQWSTDEENRVVIPM